MSEQTTTTHVFNLTAEAFQSEVIDNPTPILIDFWAPWCGPCRIMKPLLAEAAATMAGEVRVAQVNVDEEGAIAGAFGVQSIPTLVLMRGGKVLDAVAGVMPANALVARVRQKLAG
ncbi:MAG TPA: thioredoxin [Fimbriimonadaceae bacterium]|nr:thioredoxin [Fimbriimonadaceae bacterium]